MRRSSGLLTGVCGCSSVPPLAELAEERRAAARAISALRLTPVMFEQGSAAAPAAGRVRGLPGAKRRVHRAVLATLGRAPAGMDVSGLEEEFDLSAGLPRLLYVKEPAPSREPGLARAARPHPGSRPPSPTVTSAGPLKWAQAGAR